MGFFPCDYVDKKGLFVSDKPSDGSDALSESAVVAFYEDARKNVLAGFEAPAYWETQLPLDYDFLKDSTTKLYHLRIDTTIRNVLNYQTDKDADGKNVFVSCVVGSGVYDIVPRDCSKRKIIDYIAVGMQTSGIGSYPALRSHGLAVAGGASIVAVAESLWDYYKADLLVICYEKE